jgi:hypothetical protein
MTAVLTALRAAEAKTAQETLSQRVNRLQAEAKLLARDHVHELIAAVVEVERLAADIATGGDVYPAGVRDVARRLADDFGTRCQTLAALSARSHSGLDH